MKKVRLGTIHADALTFSGALDAIAELIERGRGGYVVTPNVDHVVLAESDAALRACYAEASLSLVDGKPLLWLAQLMGEALPEKISGSDITRPLLVRAAHSGWGVYFLGAAPGVGSRAAEILKEQIPKLNIVGTDAPDLGFEKDPEKSAQTLAKLRAAKPQLVLFALGCPKQELLMQRWRTETAPAVGIGIGATLDFIAGKVRRAPPWMSEVGLEWLYRLSQDPKRLAHRYLIRDSAMLGIAWRMLRTPRERRAFEGKL